MRGTRNATIVPHGMHLSVEPKTIEFHDIEVNMRYIQTLTVKNLSPFVRRIRCDPPATDAFSLRNHKNETAIAPGMPITIDIEFLTRKSGDYQDKLVIKAEDFKFEVPLTAIAPCADISFDPRVDFGTVTTKRTHQREVTFRNDGSEPGSFEILQPARILKVTPQSGRLRSGESQRVKVELTAEQPTSLHESIEVKMEGLSSLVLPSRNIDVHGKIQDQALCLYLDGQTVESLDFGSLYHGQEKVISAMLANNGPTACSFSAQVVEDGDGADLKGTLASSPAETVAKSEQPLTVAPFTGQVPPFGRIPLTFRFSPAKHVEDRGFICNREPEKKVTKYEYSGKIESEELSLTLPIQLVGKALRPALQVSPDMLQFGHCKVNHRRDIVLRITNRQEAMPLDFEIPRVPHMTINPAKGKLAPRQNMNIVVSFMPKALGKFNQDLVIKYCNNLYDHVMRCYGEAPVIGEKPIPVKGLERTGRDFDPEHVYVNQENLTLAPPRTRNLQSLTKIMKTDLSRNETSSAALDSIMLDLPEPTPYSLSPSAMQAHVRNKQRYNAHLKQTRVQRKVMEQRGGQPPAPVDIFFEDDVNMGMKPGSGLKSPRYAVDEIKPEKLHLQRALDDDSGARGVTGQTYKHDESKLIKKKFKAGPTTQAEVRDCSAALENWQLSLISVGPRVLDFGNVYVRSQMVKSFSVFNDLPQAILLSMQYDAEELNRSSPISQVVPSAQAAGFDVTVCSSIPQSFQRQVVYTINGMHAFKLLVKAEITPVVIKMSRSELHFRFQEDNLEREIRESLVLSNPGNAPARFSWIGANASFSVNPQKHIIRPGESLTTEVVFTPPASGQLVEGFLTLKTDDGEDQMLRCTGQAPEALLSFGAKKLDVGVLAVGLATDRSVPIINGGKSVGVFHVEGVAEGIQVSPMRGRVAAEGRADIEVKVLLDRPMQLDTTLSLNVRGGKAIRLPIFATAVVPNIEFLEEEIEFGQLTLGAMSSQPISLKNSSAVEGTLYVNLQQYPEFTLGLLEDRQEGREEDGEFDSSALQPVSMQQYQLAIGGITDQSANATLKGGQSATGEDEDEEANSRLYKITVQPNHTLQMQLTYQPDGLAHHTFEFPIVCAGGGKSEGLRKLVHAEALRPRMLFSTTAIDFKTKVVTSGVQSVASAEELALHNADDHAIEWVIDTEPLKKYAGVFTLEPACGTLQPEQECLVRAAFLPNEPIEYKVNLNVYISPPRAEGSAPAQEGSALPPDESKPYLSLRLKGQGTVPKLNFDRKEIVLPIVPLGVRSRCLFYIINEGYESLEVKYRLPTDNIRIPLTINFPEGQQLGITKPKIPVEILFQSPHKASSFCAKIEFLDNDSGCYSLPVSGTTENCVLTTHYYLHYNDEFYTIEGEPVQLTEKEDTPTGEAGAAPSVKTGSVSHQSVVGYGGQDTSQADFLIRWMNTNVLRNQMEAFPQDLVATNGRFLYEMIEFLSGKSVPQKGRGGAEGTSSSFRGTDRGAKGKNRELVKITALMAQYEQLLLFLKTHGAMLASVRPEHFLSSEQYLRYMQSFNTGLMRRQAEKVFYGKSMEAWLSCTLQTIKIFLLNRITFKSFKTLPGMTDVIDAPVSGSASEEVEGGSVDVKKACPELEAAINPKGLGDSNVYSVPESILLRWLNFHYWRANKDRYPPRKVVRFDTDLEDSVVLAVVILSHIPNCQAVQNLRCPCTEFNHYEENASRIIAALQEIGLSYPIEFGDIINSPKPKDMLLFVMFLYMNLPHYVPKTVIVFCTMLGVNMTKNIELTNPSKKAITYNVKLQGSSDFSVKEEMIKIEPKQTVSFPVEYHSRFSRMVESQIVFTSRREGNVHAAAMVFKLRSKCTGRKPKKTIPVSAVLYEIGTVDIDLENPFDEDAEFTLMLRESMVCDADRNPVKSKRCEAYEPFHLGVSRIRVKAHATAKLTVSFLPFDAPAHFVAYLGFFDQRAGEFYYELFGTSSPPLPLENYKLQVKAEEPGTKELILPHRNVQMDRARMWLDHRGAGSKQQLPDTIVYDVKLSSPYFSAPKQVTVVNAMSKSVEGSKTTDSKKVGNAQGDRNPSNDGKDRGGGGGGASATSPSVAKLSLEFRPKEPGVYPCTVTLTSDVDIRCYQIEGTGTAPNTHCALNFQTQARKEIIQEIPIVNPTEREWAIKPTFVQNGREFDGPRDFIAKKKQNNGQATTSYYPLTFKPDWMCDVKAQLVLHNAGTNETYEYELHGVAEEPLAEEHVVIKCEAREKTSYKFVVQNYSNNQASFEVESDLVHISGPSSITIEGRGKGDYELTFQPLQAGSVIGCIMFRDVQTGHYSWYTVELVTLPPKPQQMLTLTCVVRQAVAVDIQLVNPLDDVVVFDVALNGEGLLGEAEFVLAPKETATYELVFSPLLPARTKGTAVFFNDVVGEFWYDLELIAEQAPPEELDLLECELGRTAQVAVKIDNPTGQEVVLKHRSTNKINFKVIQQRVVLPPLESSTVTIEYSPSQLGAREESSIYFEHPSAGQWIYKVSGIGLEPREARQVQVVAQVNRPVSQTITFKNPFLETIHALIVLESSGEKNVFELLNRKAKVQIGPLATTQIPFSFCPPSMTQHSAELAVSVVKPPLTWTYQIQGVAEAPADSTLHSFVVQAREVLETYYILNLVGLDTAPASRHGDQLMCQLEVPQQQQSIVSKCFDISIENSPDPAQRPRDKSQVSLKVKLAPLRPFVAMCNLVITRASGGRWRFDVKLEATEPEVDDTISIQSPLNKPASVAFRLTNHSSVYAEFDAFFDAESAYEFTVSPTSGVLEPAGTSGTTFVITYKPTEYGKPVQGKLIIQTEDVYWSYLVKGTHPKYSAPVADKPKVATRLSKDVAQEMQRNQQARRKKNFIRDNMAGGAAAALRDE
mmetsp:Transcript_76352/g.221693  ORF Transcript_76352/g.221693 Transcript_76352/m.221693 type:complete len:2886 (+) Transcript_76352:129-8786(+)